VLLRTPGALWKGCLNIPVDKVFFVLRPQSFAA
jgi:hypothetical protein